MIKFQVPDVEIRTTVPGAEVVIGRYGVATNTAPCLVPAYVAQELAGRDEFAVGAQVSTAKLNSSEDRSRSLEEASGETDERPRKGKARKGEES